MSRVPALGQKLKPSVRSKIQLPAKRVQPFYQTPEWRALIEAIVAQRGKRCEDPDHDPKRPLACSRVFGDHVVELRDGGAALDARNILLRCGSCHTRKTAASRAARMARPGAVAHLPRQG